MSLPSNRRSSDAISILDWVLPQLRC